MRAVFTLLALSLAALTTPAQPGTPSPAQPSPQPDPPYREWHASWITHPTAPLRETMVFHFRRTLKLSAVPASYIVRVSADNRFILYVNGHRAGDGPARGDLTHWRYERFDLAPLLQPGPNLITATVWNFGVLAPLAQMSDRTAFLLESESTGATSTSTPAGWLVEVEPGQWPLDHTSPTVRAYFASGYGEEKDAARYDWAWNSSSAPGPSWVPAASPDRESYFPGVNKAHSSGVWGDNPWGLVPDTLPPMEYTPTPPGTSVRVDPVTPQTPLPQLSAFPSTPVTIPASTHVHILLDRKTLTTAYPLLTVSGGKGAQIRLTYAEALYDKNQRKGDRDEVGDRAALGLNDIFLPDGGTHRSFEPLWWRTWRYLDLEIQTAADPLALESLTANFTAYPFRERATFVSGDADLDKIWDISWRTARLDAHETYMDTPYYEQLQYIGDTRIQALISYAVTGDGRLARQALQAFDQSRTPGGLTRSRYPSSLPQDIAFFALYWIGMEHDYWLYQPDPEQVRSSLMGTRAVLDWFAKCEQPDGLLHTQFPCAQFGDWTPTKGSMQVADANGESCVTTLGYLGALDDAADLESALGDPLFATRYRARAAHVRAALLDKCWTPSRGLFADNPSRTTFSHQASILAVLYDVIPKDQQQNVLRQILLSDLGTSYYFRFYFARALDHAGLADEYLRSLDPWRKMLPLHFSTWPEHPTNSRSDSHAWSAHPIYDLLTLVAGIEPASPGFATVRIAPHIGTLPSLTATFPHPQGLITVEYHRQAAGLDATVTLPGTLTGTFVFNGKTWPLHPGQNTIQAP